MTGLPDLDVSRNIVEDHIRLAGPMIFAALFEELKVFQAADRIVEQFQQGMLPIGDGRAGAALHVYGREAPKRIGERQRRKLVAAGQAIVRGDPACDSPWLRFVSAVSSLARKGGAGPAAQQQVRKAARDLAGNLSLHGKGWTGAPARKLQAQIDAITGLLRDPEIRRSHGARDMWQVVDRVAADALGGARNGARHRRLAKQGAIITAWLADNAGRIERGRGPLIDATRARDLVKACELWLADAAREPTGEDAEKGW